MSHWLTLKKCLKLKLTPDEIQRNVWCLIRKKNGHRIVIRILKYLHGVKKKKNNNLQLLVFILNVSVHLDYIKC